MIRKLRLREADSDYVKIGNMVLPKNASGFGYADYDTVAKAGRKAYNAEKEAERRAEKERQDRIASDTLRSKGLQLYKRFQQLVLDTSNLNELYEEVFDLLVPDSGGCETEAGELIRAMSRLRYRDWNDGDKFYDGYGLETCASSAAYLMKYGGRDVQHILYNIMGYHGDSQYTKALEDASKKLIEYLESNEKLFTIKPHQDCIYFKGDYYEEIQEAGHSWEFEINTYDMKQAGISDSDIEDFVYGCKENYRDAHISHPYRDVYYINGLTRDEYEELEEDYWRWEEDFINEYSEEDDEEE